jgi:L-alanine-DL-glutamate epimerase-like enolase superfamily enzyme
MRITGIEARLYRIPPTVQIQDSIQRISHWEFVVTTVTTDAGVTGTGFAYTLGIGGTAVRELVGTYLAPLVLGADPVDVERIWTRCW